MVSIHLKKRATWPWLEGLLVLSVLALLGQLLGPQVLRWRQRPIPGRLGIEYLEDSFFEGHMTTCLSSGYLVALPNHYDQSNTWPLILFLHGSGERGIDPAILWKTGQRLSDSMATDLPAILLLPQCRPRANWQPEEVVDFLEHCRQHFRVDERRIYLVGYSMGAFGAQATAEKFANRFAAVVMIAGGNSECQASQLVSIPQWVFHGALDESIPVEESQKLVESLRRAGGDPLLTLFPDGGHGITQRVFQSPDLWHWLRKQKLAKRVKDVDTKSVKPGKFTSHE